MYPFHLAFPVTSLGTRARFTASCWVVEGRSSDDWLDLICTAIRSLRMWRPTNSAAVLPIPSMATTCRRGTMFLTARCGNALELKAFASPTGCSRNNLLPLGEIRHAAKVTAVRVAFGLTGLAGTLLFALARLAASGRLL